MHRRFFFLFTFIIGNWALAQQPNVTITPLTISNTSFEIQFTPNENCSFYDILAMPEDEINQWTSMFGMSLEELITSWGIRKTGIATHTWTDMDAGRLYKVLVLPFAADSTAAPYQFVDVSTPLGGGEGRASVAVAVTDITDSTAFLTCTPNEHTALFYDGLITAEFLHEIGLDSACTIFREAQISPYYTTDSWLWQSLIPGTDYYAIAFGQNGLSEWGDTTYCTFSTLEATSIATDNWQPVLVYPMPNNGTFNLVGEELLGGTAYLYSMNGQLLQTIVMHDNHTQISTELPAGSYLLHVTNGDRQSRGSRIIVIQ